MVPVYLPSPEGGESVPPLYRCENSSVWEKRIAVEPLPSDTGVRRSFTARPYRLPKLRVWS